MVLISFCFKTSLKFLTEALNISNWNRNVLLSLLIDLSMITKMNTYNRKHTGFMRDIFVYVSNLARKVFLYLKNI